MKILTLGLGNELLADDGVGILAVRKLSESYSGQADFIETNLSGLALMDFFLGYDRAIVIDAIKTNKHAPGSLLELAPEDLGGVSAPSPHYSGFPEMTALARELDLDFPKEIKILALEVDDPYTVGGALSEVARKGLDSLAKKAGALLREWNSGVADA
jgi:hydrogenase maturation protease